MTEDKTQDDFLHIRDLLNLFLRDWYWFVVSVVVCLSVAITYIVITPPNFTRSASILIKNSNSSGRSTNSGMESFADIGFFQTNTDARSEVYILQSPSLMEEVVERLKLNYNYSLKYKSVRTVDLYNETPIVVTLDSAMVHVPISFSVNLEPSDRVELSDFMVNGTPLVGEVRGALSDSLHTPYGPIIVRSAAGYGPAWIGKAILFSSRKPSLVAKSYSNRLTVSLGEDNVPIIQLSFIDPHAQRAEDVLATLISVYNENWIKDKNRISSSTSEFINERLQLIEGELGNVDKDISSFKSENLLPDVHAASNLYLSQSSDNTSKLMAVQNQLSMARYIRSYIEGATRKAQLLPANTGIDNRVIENHIERYNALLLQKNSLTANSSEHNPIVADMTQTLNSMKDVIVRSIDDYISTLTIQLDNARQEEKRTNSKIASNPNQAKYLLSVERQQKVKEALYLFLLQKREENELTQTFTAYNTKVVNDPDGSSSPTSPRRNIILLAAFVVGLIIPALILFMKESMQTLVREKKDLESVNIPFIGEIPLLRKARIGFFGVSRRVRESESKVIWVVENRNRNLINEAFRNIRTNIDFMCPQGDTGTVIMTTSFNPGSGKTFTTLNTALCMVMKGARTIVLDVDLRKATLSSVVNSPRQGLANYLNGTISDWKTLISKDVLHAQLDIIPVGKIPPNPSELLLGERFDELIHQLKAEYDYVFLDCPPVSMIADTSIIGHVADLTLFIIRAGLFDKRFLPEIEHIREEGRLQNIALILNGLEYASGKYGYRRYGYRGYGKYGYAYGGETHSEEA